MIRLILTNETINYPKLLAYLEKINKKLSMKWMTMTSRTSHTVRMARP